MWKLHAMLASLLCSCTGLHACRSQACHPNASAALNDPLAATFPDSPYAWRSVSVDTDPAPWMRQLDIRAPATRVASFANPAYRQPDGRALRLRGVVAVVPVSAGVPVVSMPRSSLITVSNSQCLSAEAGALVDTRSRAEQAGLDAGAPALVSVHTLTAVCSSEVMSRAQGSILC